jgi:hypothetical protein
MMQKQISISSKALQYLLTGDLDDACRAIALHTQGVHLSEWLRAHHPTHVESIRRCRLLLETCPEIQSKFDTMADVSQSWAAIVTAWPEICGAMDNECPNWRKTLWADGAWQGQLTITVLQAALQKG